MWRRLPSEFLGLLLLGPACVTPELVSPDGLDAQPGEIYLLVDDHPGGHRVRRLEEVGRLSWTRTEAEVVALELWAYDCAGGLPVESDWVQPPACLPPPKRRYHYDPEARRWLLLDDVVAPLVEFCSNCALSRLEQVAFEFPERGTPYLASAALIAPDQLLALVGDGSGEVLPTYYWVEGDQARELTLEGVPPAAPPQLGAILKRADGELFGMGSSLWRLRLEPEADPTALHFEPWMPGLAGVAELSEARGAAAEISDRSMILIGAHGSVYELSPRGLTALRGPRGPASVLGSHPVDILPYGPRSLFVVGVGEGKMPWPDSEQVEMSAYGLIVSDATTETSTVTGVAFSRLPRAATLARCQRCRSDQSGPI